MNAYAEAATFFGLASEPAHVAKISSKRERTSSAAVIEFTGMHTPNEASQTGRLFQCAGTQLRAGRAGAISPKLQVCSSRAARQRRRCSFLGSTCGTCRKVQHGGFAASVGVRRMARRRRRRSETGESTPECVLTLAEAVLESPGEVLQVASAPSPRGLAPDGLLAPVVCTHVTKPDSY